MHHRSAYLTRWRNLLRPSSVMMLLTSTAIECLRRSSRQHLGQSKEGLSVGGNVSRGLQAASFTQGSSKLMHAQLGDLTAEWRPMWGHGHQHGPQDAASAGYSTAHPAVHDAANLGAQPPCSIDFIHFRTCYCQHACSFSKNGELCRRASAQAGARISRTAESALSVSRAARAPACTCARCKAAGPPTSLSSAAMTPLLMGACLEAFSTLCRSCRTTSSPSFVSCMHVCMRIQSTRASAIDIDACVHDRHKCHSTQSVQCSAGR